MTTKTTTKKSTKTIRTSANGAAYPCTPPGDMPPVSGAPATPEGWKARPAKGRGKSRGPRMAKEQVTSAVAAAGEIARSPTYAEDFGPRAPSATTVGFLMTNAAKWRTEWDHAEAYLAYVAEQRQAWENATLDQMQTLKPAFAFVASREPAVAEKYTATAKFLAARSASAKRAASTRREKRLANGKAPAAAASPSEPAAPATAPPHPASTTPAE
jgi:hypothetical protein